MEPCPGCEQRELLLWFAAGTLSGEEAAVAEKALATCERCQEAFRLDRLLAESARTPALSAVELLDLATSSRQDLSHVPEADRAIVSILRAVDAEEAEREASWLGKLRGLADRTVSLSPAWAYLLVLLLAYPAYRGLTVPGFGGGPRLLSQPVALGDLARAASGEAGLVRAGADSVVTIFVPVDPAYRYALVIEDGSGRIVYREDHASPFDGIGTFAILLPAGSLPPGTYEILVDELEGPGKTPQNVYRFTFSLERE
jgi:hypothetical protein